MIDEESKISSEPTFPPSTAVITLPSAEQDEISLVAPSSIDVEEDYDNKCVVIRDNVSPAKSRVSSGGSNDENGTRLDIRSKLSPGAESSTIHLPVLSSSTSIVEDSVASAPPSVLEIQPVQVPAPSFEEPRRTSTMGHHLQHRPHAPAGPPKDTHLFLSHKFIVGYFIFNYLDHLVRSFCKEKGVSNSTQAKERIRRVLDRYQSLNAALQQRQPPHQLSAAKMKMNAFLSCQLDVGAIAVHAGTAIKPGSSVGAGPDVAKSLTDEEDELIIRIKKQCNYLSKRNALILRAKAEDMKQYQSEVVTVMRRCVKDAKDISVDQKMLAAFAVRAKSSYKALLNLYKSDVVVLKTVAEDALENCQAECADPTHCPYKDALEQVLFDTGRSLKAIASQNGPFSLLAECLEMMVKTTMVVAKTDSVGPLTTSVPAEEESKSGLVKVTNVATALVSKTGPTDTGPCSSSNSPQDGGVGWKTIADDSKSSLEETPLLKQEVLTTATPTDGLNLLCAAMEGDLK